jgi:hypothetical protein
MSAQAGLGADDLPIAEICSARASTRSAAKQAWVRISIPPASSIRYSAVIASHSALTRAREAPPTIVRDVTDDRADIQPMTPTNVPAPIHRAGELSAIFQSITSQGSQRGYRLSLGNC